MPFLPILFGALVGGSGVFIGSQADDALDPYTGGGGGVPASHVIIGAAMAYGAWRFLR